MHVAKGKAKFLTENRDGLARSREGAGPHLVAGQVAHMKVHCMSNGANLPHPCRGEGLIFLPLVAPGAVPLRLAMTQ